MMLARGSEGPEVAALQERLAAAGFPVRVDGDFGGETERALAAFQQSAGLQTDAVYGPKSQAALEIPLPRANPSRAVDMVAAALSGGAGQGASGDVALVPVQQVADRPAPGIGSDPDRNYGDPHDTKTFGRDIEATNFARQMIADQRALRSGYDGPMPTGAVLAPPRGFETMGANSPFDDPSVTAYDPNFRMAPETAYDPLSSVQVPAQSAQPMTAQQFEDRWSPRPAVAPAQAEPPGVVSRVLSAVDPIGTAAAGEMPTRAAPVAKTKQVQFEGRSYQFPADATDEEIAAVLDGENPAPASDPRDNWLGKVDAGMRGAADMLTFGTADEIAAGLQTGAGLWGDYDKALAEQRAIDAADADQRGGYRLAGQIAGGVGGGAGLAGAGLSLGANAARAGAGLGKTAFLSGIDGALLGGAQGFGSGEGDVDQRLESAKTGAEWGFGAGALAPYISAGIGKIAQSIISPFKTDAARQAAAAALAQEGVDLTAGQRTGSRALRYAEGEIGGAAAERTMDQQAEQFTAAALRRAGINAPRATPDVIDDGFRTIGQQFDGLAARNQLRPDQQMVGDLAGVWRDYASMVPESARAPAVENMLGDVLTAAQRGPIDGSAYQALRSRLDRMARTAKADPQLSEALRGIKDTLDDAMERSIGALNPRDLGAWQEVRRQYRNMLVIEKAATSAGENAALGLISPSALRNATVNMGRRAYARGQGDFAELARSGEAMMKPLPQSGTAPRLAARNLGNMIPTILGAGAGGAGGGIPGAIIGASAGAALPKVVGALMMTKAGQAYLGNQIAPRLSPAMRAVVNAILTNEGAGAAGRLSAP